MSKEGNFKNAAHYKTVWAHQRKMSLYPDLPKQAQKVALLRKMAKLFHSQICFNNVYTYGNLSDKKLNFYYYN